MKKLFSVLFLVVLATAACDDGVDGVDDVSGIDEQGQVEALAAEDLAPSDRHPPMPSYDEADDFAPPSLAQGECGCGNFVDEDEDGVCDLAESGECRRARTGRCPCGSDCSGGC